VGIGRAEIHKYQSTVDTTTPFSQTTAQVPASVPLEPTALETVADSVLESEVGGLKHQVKTGAAVVVEQTGGDLEGKRVGLIVNSASTIQGEHLVDALVDLSTVEVAAIFAPEHGWRGDAAAGETVLDEVDETTGLFVYSLYGNSRQPDSDVLATIDVLVFDLQDVGARYYTYISTLGLAMQAAADTDTAFVVLDRPNPRGGLHISGPVRSDDQESFVGQYPVPSLYGMTAGELALAIKGERWLDGLDSLDLAVVEMQGWDRSWLDGEALANDLNERNLPGVSFDVVSYVPKADATAPDPQHEGLEVFGVALRVTDESVFEPTAVGVHLFEAVGRLAPNGVQSIIDRTQMFDLLAGNTDVRAQLVAGVPASIIVESWNEELSRFEELRSSYLIYGD